MREIRWSAFLVLSLIAVMVLVSGTPSMGHKPDTNWVQVAVSGIFALLAIAWRPE